MSGSSSTPGTAVARARAWSVVQLKVVLRALATTIVALGVLWAIQALNSATNYSLSNDLGVVARQPRSLPKIFTVELVHVSYQHIEGNSIALAVLMFLVALRGTRRFVGVTVFIIGVGGALYWLFGPANIEAVGASSLIFGYFGYLLLAGLVEGSYLMAAVALGVGALAYLFYNGDLGNIVTLLTPNQVTNAAHISWQGHLTGLIAGIFATGLYVDGAPEAAEAKKAVSKKEVSKSGSASTPPKPPAPIRPSKGRKPASGLDAPGGISDAELDKILKDL